MKPLTLDLQRDKTDEKWKPLPFVWRSDSCYGVSASRLLCRVLLAFVLVCVCTVTACGVRSDRILDRWLWLLVVTRLCCVVRFLAFFMNFGQEITVRFWLFCRFMLCNFSVLFLSVFAGIYRERLWPRVCCRKSAFWIEMGKLVPGFILHMRVRMR